MQKKSFVRNVNVIVLRQTERAITPGSNPAGISEIDSRSSAVVGEAIGEAVHDEFLPLVLCILSGINLELIPISYSVLMEVSVRYGFTNAVPRYC